MVYKPEVHFPSYSATRLGGYDGVLNTVGASILAPTEGSVWEISVRADKSRKATQDYDLRTADPLGMDPTQLTYIALNGRRWAGKERWVQKRVLDRQWAHVKAYDAIDLAQWLSQAPSVAVWFSSRLGRPVDQVSTVASYFRNWSARTEPMLNETVILAGRDQELDSLHQRLRDRSGVINLRASTKDESIAFACAAILTDPEHERDDWVSRSLIVEGPRAWSVLMQEHNSAG